MIRKYTPADKNDVLQLLRLNSPKFFAPEEEKDLIKYLDTEAQHYYVYESDNLIIGAAGINFGFEGNSAARISWDFVHPGSHGSGIGSQLTKFRIAEIKKHPNIDSIIVRTSQFAFGFYEKMGFTLESIKKDYWSEGYDLYLMRVNL